jgi:glyoxylase-like metal-dependent hydrolase (beta-lactamase superfamily II)
MTTSNARPAQSKAEVFVLADGYVRADPDGTRHVGSSVSFVRDGDVLVIVDPGFQASHELILSPLAALGAVPDQITDVVFSHHHPDHTLNAALFPNARFHDNWAMYHNGDIWVSRQAEGVELSPSIMLIETPGHTPQDITTLAGTSDGIVAFTHLWTTSAAIEDPLAADSSALHTNRVRVLSIANRIVPGHGTPFNVDDTIPR